MRTLNAIQIVILLFSPVIALAQSANLTSQEQPGPWLRIYSEYVQGVYVDADRYQAGQVVKLDAVVVALSTANQPYQFDKPRTRLINYANGKTESMRGCLFTNLEGFAVSNGPPEYACDNLRLRATKTLVASAQVCAKNNEKNRFAASFFVSEDLKRIQCLLSIDGTVSVTPTAQPDVKTKSMLEIENRFENLSAGGTKPSEVMGQTAYLNLEGDRAFGCYKYGTPVTYRSKLLPADLADTTMGEVQNQLPVERWSESYRHPSQIYYEQPLWQKQYLIKTKGFSYYCWNARRVIDEPEEVGLFLNDGTALLRGNVSVLRVRLKDGGTNAPAGKVRVVESALARNLLLRSCRQSSVGGDPQECIAINAGWNFEAYRRTAKARKLTASDIKVYNSHVIRGIDLVLQQLFINSNR